MNSPQNASRTRLARRIVGVATVIAVTASVALYAANHWRKVRAIDDLVKTLPTVKQPPVPMDDVTDASLGRATDSRVQDTSDVGSYEMAAPEAPAVALPVPIDTKPPAAFDDSLESKTVEQLYELARDRNIAGRSSMRKAQLINALRTSKEN